MAAEAEYSAFRKASAFIEEDNENVGGIWM